MLRAPIYGRFMEEEPKDSNEYKRELLLAAQQKFTRPLALGMKFRTHSRLLCLD